MTFVIGDIAKFSTSPGNWAIVRVISIISDTELLVCHAHGVMDIDIHYLTFVKHCSEATADDPVWWHCDAECEGVVCEPECYGYDRHETVCHEGVCIKGALIEANSTECGYVPPDPCEGVVCDPLCDENADKYETVCDDGVCIRGVLIEENSPDCPGYVPFVCNEGDVRESQTCWDGSTIHKEICRDNAWVASGEVCTDEPDPDPDPCDGVVCPYYCVGVDKWSQKCVINEAGEATCVADALIEKNSAFCGYIPPDPDPDPENKSVAMIIIAAIIAYTLGIIG